MSKYDIEAIRKRLKETQGGGHRADPDEFKPEKATNSIVQYRYRFFILPPFNSNDTIRSGKPTGDMGVQCFIQHGQHWVGNKPYACPRIYNNSECPLCSIGFELYKELKNERLDDDTRTKRKQAIGKRWMPSTFALANIYFLDYKGNPEALRNTVRFYNFPQSCVNIWEDTLTKDGPGDDPQEPEPYGVFFDEQNAYAFELAVHKQGKGNSYSNSKFLYPPRPIGPDAKTIDLILRSRHDLFTKISMPDPAAIAKLADQLMQGDDAPVPVTGRGFDQDETDNPTSQVPETPTNTDRVNTSRPSAVTQEAKSTKPVLPDHHDHDDVITNTNIGQSADEEEMSPEIMRLINQLKDND